MVSIHYISPLIENVEFGLQDSNLFGVLLLRDFDRVMYFGGCFIQ